MSKKENENIKENVEKKDYLKKTEFNEDKKDLKDDINAFLSNPNYHKVLAQMIDNNYKNAGLEQINSQVLGGLLGNPSFVNLMRNVYSNPDLVKSLYNIPQMKEMKKNNPLFDIDPNLVLQLYTPENSKLMSKILLEQNEKNNFKKSDDEEEKKEDEDLNEEYSYYADKYKNELIQLKSLGFTDTKLNIDILNECDGNFNEVMRILIES